MKKVGIFGLFKSVTYKNEYYCIVFKIKPEAVRHFSKYDNRSYDEMGYFRGNRYIFEIDIDDYKRWR